MRLTTILPGILLVAGCTTSGLVADASIECRNCERWNQPFAPVALAEDTWYVGVHGLGSILIRTDEGLILLDGGLPQSAPYIAANIESLGFSLKDVRLIGLSHAHYDHAGGLAALQRASGARVVARAPQADALRAGGPTPDDPQFAPPRGIFPPVEYVDVIEDGWSINMGAMKLTAIATPGHTPGGTSWLWTDCIEDECSSIAYVDSLTPISADGFRYSDGTGDILRQTALRVVDLDCDMFLAPHPERFGLHDGTLTTGEHSCADYAQQALDRLARRLEDERRGH